MTASKMAGWPLLALSLTFLTSQPAFSAEFGKKQRREILLRAVQLALSIQPSSAYPIEGIAFALIPWGPEACGPLEALFEKVRHWAEECESVYQYEEG